MKPSTKYDYLWFLRQAVNWTAPCGLLMIIFDVTLRSFPNQLLTLASPYVDGFGLILAAAGVVLTVSTIYMQLEPPSPPERISKKYTAPIMIVLCLLVLVLWAFWGLAGSLSANGLGFLGICGALFRILPNPAYGTDPNRF